MRPRIAKGVHVILYPGLVTPLDAVSVLVSDGETHALIDAGSGLPASNMQLVNGIVEAGYDPRGLEWVINTHCHIHNAGGDKWIRDLLHVKIAAHRPDSEAIEKGDPEASDASRIGLIMHPAPVTLHLTGDQRLELGRLTLDLIHTPGHTPGSMSILLETGGVRVLIAGDALASLSRRWGSSEEDWWRSLERIRELRPEVLCTSITCYIGEAARDYIRRIEGEGPRWVE